MDIRDLLIGPPLPTKQMAEEKLNRIQALAAFSPDALSSIAYANEEIFLALAVAGAAGLAYSWPIALTIACLLAIVGLSYYQTIQAYPNGGGSYTVARENLGRPAGLVAAAALMIDYVLTAAVSATAGIAAIASAFPTLWPYKVPLALLLVAIITLANLRGLREAGKVMTIPVYFFLGSYLLMLGYGAVKAVIEGPGSLAASAPPAAEPVTLFLVMHAFASGCTALTGIEAISNGVPAFKPPESKNAGTTLIVMATLMGILFAGSIGLTQYFAVIANSEETILSALSHRIVGSGILYFIVQLSTLLILAVAANTSFADFPRVASILARDGYMPRQFAQIGDRLVFSNGILTLGGLACLLIILFNGDTHALVPLFAVGAFLAFTLSQSGMVLHWKRQQGQGWQLKAFINGIGAIVTALTLLVVALSKFASGAWIIILVIPFVVMAFRTIESHYNELANELTLVGLPPSLRPMPKPRVVVPIGSLHRGVIKALRYAQSISDDVTCIYVEIMPGEGEKVVAKWQEWVPDISLVVLPSPYRSTLMPILEFLDQTDHKHNDGQLATVVLPQFIPIKWWQNSLHNQTAWLLKLALLYRRRKYKRFRAIIDVPFFIKK